MVTQSVLAHLQSFGSKALIMCELTLLLMIQDLLPLGEQTGQSRPHQLPVGSRSMSTMGVRKQRLRPQGRPRRARRILAQCQVRKRQCKTAILS